MGAWLFAIFARLRCRTGSALPNDKLSTRPDGAWFIKIKRSWIRLSRFYALNWLVLGAEASPG